MIRTALEYGLPWLGRVTLQAALLVGLVLLVQCCGRDRLPPRWRYALWWVVVIRLVLPLFPSSSLSIFNVTRLMPSASIQKITLYRGAPVLKPRGESERGTPRPAPPTVASASASQAPAGPAAAPASKPSPPRLPASPPWATREWLGVLWLLGAVVLGVRLALGVQVIRGQLRRGRPVRDAAVLAMVAECRETLKVRQPLELLETGAVQSPALFGFGRIQLLLPEGMVATFSPAEFRHVLLHEMAHLRRKDVWMNWLMSGLQVLHWFNPVLWLGFSRMRADRELACDALALSFTREEERASYGETIIRLWQGISHPAVLPGLVGVLEDKVQMQRRLRMIARFTPGSRGSWWAIALLAALGLFTLTDAQIQMASTRPSTVGKPGAGPTASTVETGDVVEPKTGLKFVVTQTIAETNDIIAYDVGIVLSPNNRFLLWSGRVVPLDGRPAFALKELKGAGIAAWSPDGHAIAFNSRGLHILPVSPETGRPTGDVRRLLEEKEDWFRGQIYWSTHADSILFVKWNGQMQREVGSIALGDGRLNRQPHYADFGILSPDGNMTAYAMPEDGIWAKPTGGGDPRILRARTGGWLFDDPATWNPDGQWLASAVNGWKGEEIHFTRFADRRRFDVFPPEAAGVFVGSSADGKKLRFYRSSFALSSTTKIVPVSGEPAFSVDQSLGLLEPENHYWSADSASLTVVGITLLGQQLWTLPVQGGDRAWFNLASLGKKGAYIWSLSPDGRRLLYGIWPNSQPDPKLPDFYTVPISLKNGKIAGPATLVFKGWRNPMPQVAIKLGAWSPDGTKIVLPHQDGQETGLWRLSADGGPPVRLGQISGQIGQNARWSPDGRAIAFDFSAADREFIQVIPAIAGAAQTVLTTPKGQIVPFAWSPDSQEIMVARDGTISGLRASDDRERVLVRLTDAGCETVAWLGWSPDGQRLALYGQSAGGPGRLYLFSPATGKITTLAPRFMEATDFTWSPNSRMIGCTAVEAEKKRPAGVLRELDVNDAVQKALENFAKTPPAKKKPAGYPGPAHPPTLVNGEFRDTFDTPNTNHWDFLPYPNKEPNRGHSLSRGELVLENTYANIGLTNWTNYVIQVRLRVQSDNANKMVAGLGFRRTAFGSYMLIIQPGERNLWLGLGYPDWTGTYQVSCITSQPRPFNMDQWYTLRCEVNGSKIKAFVDGQLFIETEDDRMGQGYIALLSGSCRVHYDDFSLRLLP